MCACSGALKGSRTKFPGLCEKTQSSMIVHACSTSFVVRIASLRFFSLDMFAVPISVL